MTAKTKPINHRKNFLRGARAILQPNPRRQYRIPKRGDSARDAYAMQGDFAAVARDLTYTTEKYGKGK